MAIHILGFPLKRSEKPALTQGVTVYRDRETSVYLSYFGFTPAVGNCFLKRSK